MSVVTGLEGVNCSPDANKGTLSTGGVGIMAVKVNSAGTSATHTTNSYRSWSVDWIAPSSGSGSVQFNLAGVSANGNGGTGGDVWGSTTITVPEGGGPAPNNPPSASGLQFTPSNPVTTDTLTPKLCALANLLPAFSPATRTFRFLLTLPTTLPPAFFIASAIPFLCR